MTTVKTLCFTLYPEDHLSGAQMGPKQEIIINFLPLSNPAETTYVSIYKHRSGEQGRRFENRIAEIPVHHPDGIILDENNWAQYLYLNLRLKDRMRIEYARNLASVGCTSIRSRPSFGYYYFELNSALGDFGLIVDRPESTGLSRPERLTKKATIIKTPHSDPRALGDVLYNDYGIYFYRSRGPKAPIKDSSRYRALFHNPLTPEQAAQIYVKEIITTQHSDDDDRMVDLSSIQFAEISNNPLDLRFRSVYGFEYFESVDGKVIFTLQSDPVFKAWMAVHDLLRTKRTGVSEQVLWGELNYATYQFMKEHGDKKVTRNVLEQLVGMLKRTEELADARGR